jgi:excinuclease UvrABC ATPase subunit
VRHRIAIIIGILSVTGLSVGAFYARRGEAAPSIVTASVTRGPIVNAIAASLHDKRVVILAPVFFHAENRGEVLMQLIKAGYFRAWIGGEVCDLKETDTSGTTSLELVITRMRVDESKLGQITEAIEQAFEISKGTVNVLEESDGTWISHRFTSRFACNKCGTEFIEPTPHLFSFNSPLGACTSCQGYGRIIGIDMEKVIPNRALRLDERSGLSTARRQRSAPTQRERRVEVNVHDAKPPTRSRSRTPFDGSESHRTALVFERQLDDGRRVERQRRHDRVAAILRRIGAAAVAHRRNVQQR